MRLLAATVRYDHTLQMQARLAAASAAPRVRRTRRNAPERFQFARPPGSYSSALLSELADTGHSPPAWMFGQWIVNHCWATTSRGWRQVAINDGAAHPRVSLSSLIRYRACNSYRAGCSHQSDTR